MLYLLVKIWKQHKWISVDIFWENLQRYRIYKSKVFECYGKKHETRILIYILKIRLIDYKSDEIVGNFPLISQFLQLAYITYI